MIDDKGKDVILDDFHSTKKKPTMFVAQVIRLRAANESSPRKEGLLPTELLHRNSSIIVRPMASKYQNSHLFFPGQSSSKEFSVSGAFTQVLQLDIGEFQGNTVTCGAIADLEEIFKIIMERITNPSQPLVRFLYECAPEVVHHDHNLSPIFQLPEIHKEETVCMCPMRSCGLTITDESKALQHQSYHYLIVNDVCSEMCPFCFGPVDKCCPVFLVNGQLKMAAKCMFS